MDRKEQRRQLEDSKAADRERKAKKGGQRWIPIVVAIAVVVGIILFAFLRKG